jgi:hypothetical protein
MDFNNNNDGKKRKHKAILSDGELSFHSSSDSCAVAPEDDHSEISFTSDHSSDTSEEESAQIGASTSRKHLERSKQRQASKQARNKTFRQQQRKLRLQQRKQSKGGDEEKKGMDEDKTIEGTAQKPICLGSDDGSDDKDENPEAEKMARQEQQRKQIEQHLEESSSGFYNIDI